MFYAKMALIVVGLILSVPIRRFVDDEASDRVIPGRIRTMAGLSLFVWTAVVTTGRLIAYIQL